MRWKKSILSAGFIFVYTFFYAQTDISGNIIDSTSGNRITNANINIIFRDSLNAQIFEFTKAKNGRYYHRFRYRYNLMIIKVVADKNYQSRIITVKDPFKHQHLHLDFSLKKQRVVDLNPVVVKVRKRIYKKGDTIRFHIKQFTDGSEKKLKDIIQKLPGLEIDEEGNVTFRGKKVKTLLLDGDNIFDNDYNIATKHLNANTVKDIELYGHYNENEALKNLKQSDEMALNILLKKNKVDFSGDIYLGVGKDTDKNTKIDGETTILNVSKKIKGFSVGSYNNIGINHSPENFYKPFFAVNYFENTQVKAAYPIDEPYFDLPLQEKRILNNRQKFANINGLIPVNKKLKLFFKLYYISDNITSGKSDVTKYFVRDSTINYINESELRKNPLLLHSNFKLFYAPSRKENIKFTSKIYRKTIGSVNSNFFQNTNHFIDALGITDVFSHQKLIFTKRYRENSAIQFLADFGSNNVSEKLTMSHPEVDTTAIQNVIHNRRVFSLQSSLYTAYKNFNSDFLIGFFNGSDRFINNKILSGNRLLSTNDIIDTKGFIKIHSVYTLIHWKIETAFSQTWLQRNITIGQTTGKFQKPFSLFIRLNWIKSSYFRISTFFNKIKNPIDGHYILNNAYFINFNTQTEYKNVLDTYTTQSSGIDIKFSKSMIWYEIQASINQQKNGYIPAFTLSDNQSRIVYNFHHQKILSKNIRFDAETFIYPINTNIRLDAHFGQIENLSKINSSHFEKRKMNIYELKLSSGTFITKKLSFKTKFIYGLSETPEFGQSISDVNGSFDIMGRTGYFSFVIKNNCFWFPHYPDAFYWFTDVDIDFIPVKTFSFEIMLRNIFNKKNIRFTNIFPDGIFYDSTKLRPAFLMISATYSF